MERLIGLMFSGFMTKLYAAAIACAIAHSAYVALSDAMLSVGAAL